jgi:hypothetical protein
MKLKITNALLSEYPNRDVPPVSSLQFTQILTRQSSLYNTWKQMIQFSDEHDTSIEEIPAVLKIHVETKQIKFLAGQAKKIESMSIPKDLCIYKV